MVLDSPGERRTCEDQEFGHWCLGDCQVFKSFMPTEADPLRRNARCSGHVLRCLARDLTAALGKATQQKLLLVQKKLAVVSKKGKGWQGFVLEICHGTICQALDANL